MTRACSLLRYSIPLLMGCLMLVGGCAGKSTPDQQLPDEELYIDAKLGITILHPQPWEKRSLPVSSPAFRPDTVRWDIPAASVPGVMELRKVPQSAPGQGLEELVRSELVSPDADGLRLLEHPLGEAVAGTLGNPQQTRYLFAIQGTKGRYLLRFSISSADSTELLPAIERTVQSLREL